MDNMTQIVQAQPYHIKLVKGQRDAYGWEITIYGTDMNTIIEELKGVDEKMKDSFSLF